LQSDSSNAVDVDTQNSNADARNIRDLIFLTKVESYDFLFSFSYKELCHKNFEDY